MVIIHKMVVLKDYQERKWSFPPAGHTLQLHQDAHSQHHGLQIRSHSWFQLDGQLAGGFLAYVPEECFRQSAYLVTVNLHPEDDSISPGEDSRLTLKTEQETVMRVVESVGVLAERGVAVNHTQNSFLATHHCLLFTQQGAVLFLYFEEHFVLFKVRHFVAEKLVLPGQQTAF